MDTQMQSDTVWDLSPETEEGPLDDIELMRDQFFRMREGESAYVVPESLIYPDDMPVDEWRRKICQWSFRVIDHFQLDREVVTIGMNLMDRYMYSQAQGAAHANPKAPCSTTMDSQSYQLAAMTSMYMAVKLSAEDFRRKRFRLKAFVDLSRGQFTEDDILKMEHNILSALAWKVNPSTPMTFVNYLLTLVPLADDNLVPHVLRELSRYLTELAVCLDVSDSAPSQVAVAAICVSMELLTTRALAPVVRDAFWHQVQLYCPFHPSLQHLKTKLRQALWPEMILEDEVAGHPIAMARNCGLLDMEQMSPPSSPKPSWTSSPVSTARH